MEDDRLQKMKALYEQTYLLKKELEERKEQYLKSEVKIFPGTYVTYEGRKWEVLRGAGIKFDTGIVLRCRPFTKKDKPKVYAVEDQHLPQHLLEVVKLPEK